MERHKRGISLTDISDWNNKDLVPEGLTTPKVTDTLSKASKPLFVTDAVPSREPPLTGKPKSSFRQNERSAEKKKSPRE